MPGIATTVKRQIGNSITENLCWFYSYIYFIIIIKHYQTWEALKMKGRDVSFAEQKQGCSEGNTPCLYSNRWCIHICIAGITFSPANDCTKCWQRMGLVCSNVCVETHPLYVVNCIYAYIIPCLTLVSQQRRFIAMMFQSPLAFGIYKL